MAAVKVTVNGRPVDVWIDEEQNQEIRTFYKQELYGLKKSTRHQIVSNAIRNVTRPVYVGNAVRFA
jgi:hypothetical protein